jgi:succinate dehydrogenase / fumarate reductase flavoprotein subunit
MGGIPTNVEGEVVVGPEQAVIPGLYAAGECACVSVHGSNRLGTNSLLDIVVFGKRGGRAMAEFVGRSDVTLPEVPKGVEDDVRSRIEMMKAGSGGEKVAEIRTTLQNEMMDKASVFRSQESLDSVLKTVHELRDRWDRVSIDDKGEVFNYDLTEALELGYLIDLAEALVVSAQARPESRGAHMRVDHPNRDDANWMKHTLITRAADGSVSLDYKPVIGGAYEPMERKY